jgi:SAM-dependent methyltransferase
MRPALRLAIVVCLASAPSGAAQAQPPTPAPPPPAQEHAPQGADHHAHRFDNVDELARRFDDPKRDAWQMPARIIEALALPPRALVADIGAGTGYFTVRLARAAAQPKVYAVDIEPGMLAHLQHRARKEGLANVTTVQATAEGPNLPEPVDVVLIVDTYHHIPNREAYFSRLKGQLRPGARVAIVDFRKDAPEGPPVEFRFTPEQIRGEMARAGFAQVAEHDFLPRQIFLVFAPK